MQKNIIGFPGDDERLTLIKGADRGTYRWIYNRLLNFVAKVWKESKTLQFIISLRKNRIFKVYRKRCWDIQQVVCPEDVTRYHQNMDGVKQSEKLW